MSAVCGTVGVLDSPCEATEDGAPMFSLLFGAGLEADSLAKEAFAGNGILLTTWLGDLADF